MLLGLFLAIWAHLFEALCVCCADKVGLHVVDAPLWVHQILIVFAFNLNHAHYYTVNHVDRLALFLLTLSYLLTALNNIRLVKPLLLVILALNIFFKDANACASLVELLRILSARLEINIVRIVLTLVIVILRVHDMGVIEILIVVLLILLRLLQLLTVVVDDAAIVKQICLLGLRAQGMVGLRTPVPEARVTDRSLPAFQWWQILEVRLPNGRCCL